MICLRFLQAIIINNGRIPIWTDRKRKIQSGIVRHQIRVQFQLFGGRTRWYRMGRTQPTVPVQILHGSVINRIQKMHERSNSFITLVQMWQIGKRWERMSWNMFRIGQLRYLRGQFPRITLHYVLISWSVRLRDVDVHARLAFPCRYNRYRRYRLGEFVVFTVLFYSGYFVVGVMLRWYPFLRIPAATVVIRVVRRWQTVFRRMIGNTCRLFIRPN